jgi:hypothetical protein
MSSMIEALGRTVDLQGALGREAASP